MTNVHVLAAALLTAGAVYGSSACGAAPTPIPGDANQVNAVSGALGDPMWNGVVRMKVRELRDARPEDHPETLLPGADQKVMVLDAMLRNGTATQFAELLTFTLADKDGITYEIPSQYLKPSPLVVAQGAAARVHAVFVADKRFVPVKLLIQCATCATATRFAAFRVQLPPAPVPSP